MRRGALAAVVATVAVAWPSVAFAHANLTRSDPADGSVVGSAPTAAHFYFDDVVKLEPGIVAVRNGQGSVLGGKPYLVGGRELVVPLRSRLPNGDYTVLWRALSDDGHPVNGVVAFAVGLGRPPPRAAFAAPSEVRPLPLVGRWLFFAGLLAAGGAGLFRIAMPAPVEPPRQVFVISFLLVAVGGAVLVEQSALRTRFGIAVGTAAAIAAVGAALAAVPMRNRRLRMASTAPALVLLPIPTAAGHAADPGRRRLEIPIDILHVGASSLWVGGLVCLAVALRRRTVDRDTIRRFSALAFVSVAVLGGTGVMRAFGELSAVRQLWTTPYGRWLLGKTAVFLVLLGLGWVNRQRLIPAFSRSASRLYRNVAAELVLFTVLVVAVAFLTQSRPGRDARAAVAAPAAARNVRPVSGTVVLQRRRGSLAIAGRISSAGTLGGYLVWETLPEERETAVIVEDRRTPRQTNVLARGTGSQYPLASARSGLAYATASIPARLVLIKRDGTRTILSSALTAPFAARGDVVAWAEGSGQRQRVVTANVATGKRWVAADLPSCERGLCYRIDAVTLADRGVVFDRGAIGAQPSYVVRRGFSSTRPELMPIPHDPQPDLIPSSTGAFYYALGRGWYEWDFGRARPQPAAIAANLQPLRKEKRALFLLARSACADAVVEEVGTRRVRIADPAAIRTLLGVGADQCVAFTSLSLDGQSPVTTWLVTARDSHSDAGASSVILLRRAP